MRPKHILTILPVVLAVIGTTAIAKADDAQPPVGTPAASPATPATPAVMPEPKEPPHGPTLTEQHGELSVGFQGIDLSGNRNKFYQYATPPQGFFLDKLRYAPFSNEGNLGTILLQTPGDADYRDTLRLALFGGTTFVEGLAMNSRFFDSTPQVISPSNRSIKQFYLQQTLAKRFKISTRYRFDQQDQFFDIPNDPLHQRTRYNDVVAAGAAGGGYVNLTFSDQRYTDRTQIANDTEVRRYLADYLHDVGKSNSIEAKVDMQNIAVPASPDTRITSATLADSITINDTTDASVSVNKVNVRAPIVQNAYVREQQSATARISKVWNRWYGTVAYQQLLAQRVNADQTFVDTPRWQTCEVRLRGKFNDTWGMSVKGWSQALTSAPQMQTDDPRALLWSDRQYGQVCITGVTDALTGSVSWTVDRKHNNQRTTTVTSNVLNFDANWQASPTVSVFTDYTYERLAANNGTSTGLPLAQFAPNCNVLNVGVNWNLGTKTYVNADFTGFWNGNDNPLLLADANTYGKFLTVQLHQSLSGGREVGLIVCPWVYRDKVVQQQDYDARIVQVTLSTPF